FGTSVTPVSQFYFQQAFNNVMFGPWKKIAEGYGKMVLGYFGKTPMPPDEKVVEIASNQMNLPKTDRLPLDINEEDTQKGINAAIEHLKNNKIPVTDENIFIVAACGEKGIAFLQGKKNVAIRWVEKPLKKQTILIGKKPFDVELSGNKAFVNGKEYAFDFLKKEAASSKEKEKSDKVESSLKNERENKVASPLNGTVSKVLVSKGEEVDLETPLFVIEVMKMEVLIKSKHKGIVQEIKAEVGEQVEENQILAIIR
ncbi:MAG: biotin attachment protein, partial [Alphaproteobacteria bacterium]|nr:biotin attachment protein [Alphaproteobacteria bacterium]